MSLSVAHLKMNCRICLNLTFKTRYSNITNFRQLSSRVSPGRIRRQLLPAAVIAVGTSFATYQYACKVRRDEFRRTPAYEEIANDIYYAEVFLLTLLPLNALSRLWGKLNNIKLPKWSRSHILGLYVKTFGCNLNEASDPELDHYENLGQFFRRSLKPGCRPVDKNGCLTCPSDGTVLSFGIVIDDHLDQVKNMTYSLHHFLGPQTWHDLDSNNQTSGVSEHKVQPLIQNKDAIVAKEDDYIKKLKYNPDNELYQCVIYLSPGDYHRFHSPADWSIDFRRYFPGLLLSVSPKVARLVPELFNLNERVVYIGRWTHGFLAMVPVGATNVGSIKIYEDPQLLTNTEYIYRHPAIDLKFRKGSSGSLSYHKGDPFGEFNLGSTIVLLFEAPKSFKFTVKPGEKIKYGQSLGSR